MVRQTARPIGSAILAMLLAFEICLNRQSTRRTFFVVTFGGILLFAAEGSKYLPVLTGTEFVFTCSADAEILWACVMAMTGLALSARRFYFTISSWNSPSNRRLGSLQRLPLCLFPNSKCSGDLGCAFVENKGQDGFKMPQLRRIG